MYSSIEIEERETVVKNCYWPLIKLADQGFPIGIEAPAVTLAIINELDPNWISSLSKFIVEEKIEFIGSGYSQIIGPLVPAKVNEWNQKLGLECYQKLLDINPKIALVNEMAYSGGIVDQYVNADYKGIIMEWNNPRSAHPVWRNEWRYFPQKAVGTNSETVPLIWADSIAFQKFQRFVHGEYDSDEYIDFLKSNDTENDRYFSLYANDVEIFDFRPGRYDTEAYVGENSEWDRIHDLYQKLGELDWTEFVFPSQVLQGLESENGGNQIKLESPEQPIPVKKQEKYNINRWALTGRDDLGINTKCYQIYNGLMQDGTENPDDWKELCYLWSSDFRTHITEKRWIDYCERLDSLLAKCNFTNSVLEEKSSNFVDIFNDEKVIRIENNNYKIVLNKNKGLTIKSFVFKRFGDFPLLVTLDHGYYDDISLGADYYSGHAIIERPGEHKLTDLGKVIPVINQNSYNIVTNQKIGNFSFSQKINFDNEKIILKKKIVTDNSEKAIIRPFSFTFNPEAWDRESLYIATHNGGLSLEKFFLKGQNISHGDIYSSLISARHGFGNTEGTLTVGDKDKSITFECNMSVSAMIPSLVYKEMYEHYFFRLQYSAREMDETFVTGDTEITTAVELTVGYL